MDAWKHLASGKVRDLYVPIDEHPLGDVVMVVASNRISAFDHILSSEIPNKGSILTQMSVLWFDQLSKHLGLKHHFLTQTGVPSEVVGQAMICQRLNMVAIECVARGYLTGSAYKEYLETGSCQEYQLPLGLEDGAKLEQPLFTPARKSQLGEHDENVTYNQIVQQVGQEVANQLRQQTLDIYKFATNLCTKAGITLVDTKFEFGINQLSGDLTLGDEVLTPDSSRYWNTDGKSFDKQIVRNWLEHESGWDVHSNTEPPELPDIIIEQITKSYAQILEQLKGAI